jgi:hypothetical protein
MAIRVDAGHLGGHGVHQHGRGIGRATAGNVDANSLDRRPAPAQLHPGLVGPGLVGRTLARVIGADAGGGEDDGLAHVGGSLGRPGLDLLGRDTNGLGGQLDLVELAGVIEQRVDAPGPHGLQHLNHGGVDIGRRAAALVEKRLEGGGETRVGKREAAHGA